MIAGWSIFATGYLVSVAVGAAAVDGPGYETDPEVLREIDQHLPRRNRVAYGQRMMVPVVGPFIAAPLTTSASASVATAAIGVAQAVGIVVGTIGTVQYARDRKAARRVQLGAGPMPGGGAQAQLRLRF